MDKRQEDVAFWDLDACEDTSLDFSTSGFSLIH